MPNETTGNNNFDALTKPQPQPFSDLLDTAANRSTGTWLDPQDPDQLYSTTFDTTDTLPWFINVLSIP